MNTVGHDLLERTIAEGPGDRPASAGPSTSSKAALDGTVSGTRAWLEERGVAIKGMKETSAGTMLFLSECPVTKTQSTGNSDIAVGVAADGTLSFHNLHSRGEGVKWADVRDALDPKPEIRMAPGVDLSGLTGEDEPADEPEEDGEPLPPGWRPFPTDALPEPIATYARAVAEAQMLDEATVVVPLLAALGGSVNAAMAIRIKRGWLEPCIVWSCVVMRSGDGKSHALDAALCFLREYQIEELARYERESQAFDNACMENPEELPAEPRPAARCVANDATVEGLAQLLASHHRGILLERDELAGWLGSFDRYARSAGGDRPFWLSAHGGRQHLIDRKTSRSIVIPACAVSIVGTIQPGVLERMVSDQDRESGLVARLLIAHPPTPVQAWTEAEVDLRLIDEVRGVFHWLLALQRDPGRGESSRPYEIPFEPDAKAAWIRWFNTAKKRQRESPTDDHAANWSKQIGYTARLALLFELIMRATEIAEGATAFQAAIATVGGHIRLEAVNRAIRVVEWFVGEGDRILARGESSEAMKELIRLQEWIERRGGRVTVRELCKSLRRYRKQPDQARDDLEALVVAGVGQWETPWHEGKRGPSAQVFVLAGAPAG